jgi:hypothetical protein
LPHKGSQVLKRDVSKQSHSHSCSNEKGAHFKVKPNAKNNFNDYYMGGEDRTHKKNKLKGIHIDK